MSKKAKPVHNIRLGRIVAAIWANETDNGIRHNVTLSGLYKPEGEDWQNSTSFGRDDLPLVAKVAEMAHTWIFQKTQEQNGSAKEAAGGDPAQEQEPHFEVFKKVFEASSSHHRPHPSTDLAKPLLAERPMPWSVATGLGPLTCCFGQNACIGKWWFVGISRKR